MADPSPFAQGVLCGIAGTVALLLFSFAIFAIADRTAHRRARRAAGWTD